MINALLVIFFALALSIGFEPQRQYIRGEDAVPIFAETPKTAFATTGGGTCLTTMSNGPVGQAVYTPCATVGSSTLSSTSTFITTTGGGGGSYGVAVGGSSSGRSMAAGVAPTSR